MDELSLIAESTARAARDSGCRLLLTATGEEIPGDPQHSYRNILRYGFEPAYLRESYIPAPRR